MKHKMDVARDLAIKSVKREDELVYTASGPWERRIVAVCFNPEVARFVAFDLEHKRVLTEKQFKGPTGMSSYRITYHGPDIFTVLKEKMTRVGFVQTDVLEMFVPRCLDDRVLTVFAALRAAGLEREEQGVAETVMRFLV